MLYIHALLTSALIHRVRLAAAALELAAMPNGSSVRLGDSAMSTVGKETCCTQDVAEMQG